ncbi:DUF6682 family protein [Variovorax paradoxus]|uniref:phage adaptor protein n=1 Tax=Variovorax paradoxus TaxID=34073 RepID=UPI0003F9BB4E
MNVEQFIARFRLVLDDKANAVGGGSEDTLWSDEEIVDYLTEAVNEVAERALLIEDHTTPAVCNITLLAGVGEYELHPSVIRIKRLAWNGRPLVVTSTEELDEEHLAWETLAGRPCRYVHSGSDTLRLYRIPRAEDIAIAPTLALTVYRTPLAPYSVDDLAEVPELKTLYHDRLMQWMYRCAYLKKDAETFDPNAAAKHEAAFTASFGQRPDANVQRKRRDKRPPVVRMRF